MIEMVACVTGTEDRHFKWYTYSIFEDPISGSAAQSFTGVKILAQFLRCNSDFMSPGG